MSRTALAILPGSFQEGFWGEPINVRPGADAYGEFCPVCSEDWDATDLHHPDWEPSDDQLVMQP